MKLLINDKELAHFILAQLDYSKYYVNIADYDANISSIVRWAQAKCKINKGENLAVKYKAKIKNKIKKAVESDTKMFYKTVKSIIETEKEKNKKLVFNNIQYLIDRFTEEKLFDLYAKSKKQNFVKSVGNTLDKSSVMVRRKHFNNPQEDCLLRNTVGNENLLLQKIDNNYPFYFIDSGYTNFLESNKKWHRLVRNHLHTSKLLDVPVDRLNIFPNFPKPWRQDGHIIMIIEPGEFAAKIFRINISEWKQNVEKELREYTDKKIIFREKAPKKRRLSLVSELNHDDYYAVISINSNAATEAIWQGVPVITLDKHITNPVSKSKLSDINSLYRGKLAEWLVSLSYSQFTYEELVNGTAARIVKKYHV